jgi:hypothetical protein
VDTPRGEKTVHMLRKIVNNKSILFSFYRNFGTTAMAKSKYEYVKVRTTSQNHIPISDLFIFSHTKRMTKFCKIVG